MLNKIPVLSIFFAKDLILIGMVQVVLFFFKLFAASAADYMKIYKFITIELNN